MGKMKIIVLLAVLFLSTYSLKIDLKYKSSQGVKPGDLMKEIKEQSKEEVGSLSYSELNNKLCPVEGAQLVDPPALPQMRMKQEYVGKLHFCEEHGEWTITTKFILGLDWNWVRNAPCFGCSGIQNEGILYYVSDTWEDLGFEKELRHHNKGVNGLVGRDYVKHGDDSPVFIQMIAALSTYRLWGIQHSGEIGLSPASGHGEENYATKLKKAGLTDAEEFTLYLAKDGAEESYIWFGSNQDDQSEVTWVDLKLLPGSDEILTWSVKADSVKVGDTEIDLPSSNVVLDNGLGHIGGPCDLITALIKELAEGKDLIPLHQDYEGYYGVKCSSISEIKPLSFTFNGHIMTVPPEEFVEIYEGLCVLMLRKSDVPGIILGESALRGSKIIFNQADKRVGFFSQKDNLIKKSSISE